ncbi:MAG: RsmB/NOP family class I SAM-dependent RNA methyltransferase [Myxococcota bacterium]
MSDDPRLLARAARPGRIRGTALALWDRAVADPLRAGVVFAAGLREARALHSAERRLVQDALYGLLRDGPRSAALLGTDDPTAWWLGWLVRRGLDPALAAAERPGPWDAVVAGWDAVGAGLAPAERLALRHGVPPGFARRLVAQLGPDEAAALLEAGDRRAPLVIRANRRRCTRAALADRLGGDGIAATPLDAVPDGLRVDGRPNLEATAAFRDGWFEVQDEGSQRLVAWIGADGPVIDACAGAGGKALAFAAAGLPVVAVDVRAGALDELTRRARRAGVRIPVHRAPATGLTPAPWVVVDAPCTGSGVLRRHPEHRAQLDDAGIARHAELQQRILAEAARWVAPGGHLVYATCSVLADEGEQVVDGFLAEHPGFRAARAPVRTWPHRDDCDGFFAADLARQVPCP